MNTLLKLFLPKIFTRESEGQRIDRLVTESILSGPSKPYTQKDWDKLNQRVLKSLNKLENK